MKDLALPANPSKHDMRKQLFSPIGRRRPFPGMPIISRRAKLASRARATPLFRVGMPRPPARLGGAAIFREARSLAIAFRRQIGDVVPDPERLSVTQ